MPQVVDLPPIGNDQRGALASLVRVCKETPANGEPFRDFRSRLRAAKLWERERPIVMLRFLGVGGATIMPSAFMQALAAAATEDDTAHTIMDRVWQLNPLLGKTIVDLVAQRAYGKDEIYKHLGSAAFRGVVPSRPGLEAWLQIGIAAGVLRTIGIAVAPGARMDRYAQLAAGIDIDEFLAEDKPVSDPVIPMVGDDEAAAAPAEVAVAGDTSIPVAAAAPAGSPLPAPLRHLSADGVASARGRDRATPLSRFSAGFSDDVLAETSKKLADWWTDAKVTSQTYQPSDFGLDAEQWVEVADEVLYRIAVAAALAFRLDRDRAGVIAAYTALDRAGVLADLYQGTVPENLPAHVDARALMLASLAARRCAEVPELAASLDGRGSAAEAFASLDAALGDDLGDYTVTPHRIVRDTLFRLGFIASPYASDRVALSAAAKAARRAIPSGPADEILTLFSLSASCSYDCAHRKTCDFPCRERLE
jgi:hypothetical protein